MPFTFLGELQRKVHNFISWRSLCAHLGVVPVQSLGLDFFDFFTSPCTAVDPGADHFAARVYVQHVSSDG